MMNPARLATMVNQIARNLAPQGEEEAIAQTAQHIRDFWDPRMKAAIIENSPGLSPIAAQAIALLASKHA